MKIGYKQQYKVKNRVITKSPLQQRLEDGYKSHFPYPYLITMNTDKRISATTLKDILMKTFSNLNKRLSKSNRKRNINQVVGHGRIEIGTIQTHCHIQLRVPPVHMSKDIIKLLEIEFLKFDDRQRPKFNVYAEEIKDTKNLSNVIGYNHKLMRVNDDEYLYFLSSRKHINRDTQRQIVDQLQSKSMN